MKRDSLLKHLKGSGVLHSEAVEDAFRVVDRANFVPKELQEEAYED